ncbi:MAG TPA: Gfo/Idh/MocA family oxidoreductase [Thermoanaerobaculia bacterium]|nr:Gfo/Idh/MocA family oxidoreductase [Thermoanaerobaculia bacterium]
MSPGRVAFGLVGAGRIGQAYAAACRNSQEAYIAAVADPRTRAAQALAGELGCPAFPGPAEMAGALALDAALICTPPASHTAISLDLLGRGLAVLCEKPFALDAASAKRMVEAARTAGTVLAMGSKFRYVDDIRHARRIVASGILGEIVLLENAFTSRIEMANRWNSDPRLSGGGVLIDNGAHSVDIVRYLLGPITAVHAVAGKSVQQLAVEDTAHLLTRSADGAMASIDLSWSLDKELASYVVVYGSHGTLQVGWKESRYCQAGSSDWVVFGAGYDKMTALRRQIDNFSRALRGRELLLIEAEDAIASVEVIEAAYSSLRSNRWVPVTRGGAGDRQQAPGRDRGSAGQPGARAEAGEAHSTGAAAGPTGL